MAVPFQVPEETVPKVELVETIRLVVEAVPETVKTEVLALPKVANPCTFKVEDA